VADLQRQVAGGVNANIVRQIADVM
jgi:hypothetical protein